MTKEVLLQEFLQAFESEDKAACLRFALTGLSENRFDVATLYDDILTPALRGVPICQDNESACIWHEHVKSGIIRAILENSYLHLEQLGKAYQAQLQTSMHESGAPDVASPKALVMCPERELHELGARMAADALTLSGFQTSFAGANTPRHQIMAAFMTLKPIVIAISVTDPYHLVEAQKAVEMLLAAADKNHFQKPAILAGGYAFRINPRAAKAIGATNTIDSFRGLVEWVNLFRTGGVSV